MLRFNQQALAVCLMVAVLLAHSAEAKAKSAQDKFGLPILGMVGQKSLISSLALPKGPGVVDLGTAGDFAILAKSGVSTVPPSVITGDIGVSPIAQSAMTGFSLIANSAGTYATSAQVTGKLYAASDIAPTPVKMTAAVGDMEIAYTNAAGRVNPDHVEYMTGALGGATLSPGLYKFGTSVGFSTDCTLSGSSEDTWIFQIAGDISIAANKQIILAGGALARNIVWVVTGKTTHGAGSHFEGIILGATSAEFITGSSINGRVLVQTMVTLQQTTVTSPTTA
jgi:hypothetical protein